MRQAKSAQGYQGEYVESSKAGPTDRDSIIQALADELCIMYFGVSTPNPLLSGIGEGEFV
jgi:hypothetical protein